MTRPGSAILASCGDILLHGRYREIAARGQAHGVFDGLRRLLADADLVVGNMETVLAKGAAPRTDKLCLQTDPVYAPALAAAGFGLVSLANNHALDYGARGLSETRCHLQNAGIHALGAGKDLEEATRPVILNLNGLRLGFVAACHESTRPADIAATNSAGVAPLAESTLNAAIDDLAPGVDHLVVLLHWGLEYARYPTPEQARLARHAVERGASLVIGHHSHALQGIETHAGGVIAYSLANLTDADVDWRGPNKQYRDQIRDVDRESVLLRVRLTRDSVDLLDPIPLWLDDRGHPGPAVGERAERILRDLDQHSRALDAESLEALWSDSIIASRVSAPLSSWWRSGSLWDKVKGFRPGQLISLYLLIRTYLQVKLSHSESRWLLSSSRNDDRPMPAAKPVKQNRQ